MVNVRMDMEDVEMFTLMMVCNCVANFVMHKIFMRMQDILSS